MKYNRSEIMKNAWTMFKNNMGTFADCLKKAWEKAKNMTSLDVQVVFGEYDCVAYASILLPEDYTMNQVVEAVRLANYKKFRIVDTMKRFVTV